MTILMVVNSIVIQAVICGVGVKVKVSVSRNHKTLTLWIQKWDRTNEYGSIYYTLQAQEQTSYR